ncbi:MAG: hypothetical protein AAF289_02560 [Cyanobacteria bacterium P01_A01_bin.135]
MALPKPLPPFLRRLSGSPTLLLWTGAWLSTMLLCWVGLLLLLHPNVAGLSRQGSPVSVITPKQRYVPLTPTRDIQTAASTTTGEFSVVPLLGLATLCIVGSRLMMGRMRSYH